VKHSEIFLYFCCIMISVVFDNKFSLVLSIFRHEERRRGRFFIDQIFTNKNELENSYLTNKSQDNFLFILNDDVDECKKKKVQVK